MKRPEIFKSIDYEREYQDSLPQHSKEQDKHHSISDWIIFMEHKLSAAKISMYNLNKKEALYQINKVIALGVACLEYNE